MTYSEGQVIFYEYEKNKNIEKPFLVLTCCICRREILEYERVIQCPNCQTYFHSHHMSIWLDTKQTCPVCCCYFSRVNSDHPRRNATKKYVRTGKAYQCIYCNHTWEAKSSGHQLWCPECGITSCPNCKTAFGFEYLLRQLHRNGCSCF